MHTTTRKPAITVVYEVSQQSQHLNTRSPVAGVLSVGSGGVARLKGIAEALLRLDFGFLSPRHSLFA